MDDTNAFGFLDYAGLFPEGFNTASALASDIISMQSTQRFLTYFKRSGMPLDFNGRVIIKAHGNSSGQVGFAFGETDGDLDAPTMQGRVRFDVFDVAVKLKTFFLDYKIPVKQVELYICCDDSTKIVDRFYEGFHDGFENLKVIGFKTKVGLTRRGGEYRYFQLTEDRDKPHAVGATDYLVKGKLPEDEEAQKLIIVKTKGKPEPVKVPQTPDWKQQCDMK